MEIKNNQKEANKFFCEFCHFNTSRKSNYEKHLSTVKHIKKQMEIKKKQKEANKFCSEFCQFNTSYKSNYEKHLTPVKHTDIKNEQKELINADCLLCKCGKQYKNNSGLWKHQKKCKSEETKLKSTNEPTDKELIMTLIKNNNELVKENTEFKNMMMKVLENGTHTTINNNNNNNNKTFNLQFFLNETCKDAMNIMDFVESIQLQLSDLENVGKLGYAEGISNIITKNLKALDVTKRPVHCADKKREILYVKDEDKWEKEDDNKKKIRKAIKKVASKNQRLIPKFKEAHPDCGEYSSLFSNQYDHIILESMGGSGDNDIEKEDKIIRNISSVTTINK